MQSLKSVQRHFNSPTSFFPVVSVSVDVITSCDCTCDVAGGERDCTIRGDVDVQRGVGFGGDDARLAGEPPGVGPVLVLLGSGVVAPSPPAPLPSPPRSPDMKRGCSPCPVRRLGGRGTRRSCRWLDSLRTRQYHSWLPPGFLKNKDPNRLFKSVRCKSFNFSWDTIQRSIPLNRFVESNIFKNLIIRISMLNVMLHCTLCRCV